MSVLIYLLAIISLVCSCHILGRIGLYREYVPHTQGRFLSYLGYVVCHVIRNS